MSSEKCIVWTGSYTEELPFVAGHGTLVMQLPLRSHPFPVAVFTFAVV
jgi:hypothetical protein